MLKNGEFNWVNLLTDAVVAYNKNKQTIINRTPVDSCSHPEKVRYYVKSTRVTPKSRVGDYDRKADKRNIFSKGYTSNWNREIFKINKVLKNATTNI